MATKNIKKLTYDLNALMEDFKSSLVSTDGSEIELSLDAFKAYLTSKGLSTVHADSILAYYKDPKNNPLKFDAGSIQIRKTHPIRDNVIKKVLIPAGIVGAILAYAIPAVYSAGLIDGSTVMFFTKMSQTPGFTGIGMAVESFVYGALGTVGLILGKYFLTKLHYKLWYKNAKANLEKYSHGTQIEALGITNLIEKIQKTKRTILEIDQGKWYTKIFTFIPKHILNAVNRNRIHHLEAYTKELLSIYEATRNSEKEEDVKKLPKIVELLKQVEDFISQDVAESKLYAMLTCDQSGTHTHKTTIENIDIFANLMMYVDAFAESRTRKTAGKIANDQSKNIRQKTLRAGKIFNNSEHLITSALNIETPSIPEETSPVEDTVEEVITEEEVAVVEEENIQEEVETVEETETIDEVVEETPVEEHRIITEMISENNEVIEDEIVEEVITEEEVAVVEEENIQEEVETVEETETIDEVVEESPVEESTNGLVFEFGPTDEESVVETLDDGIREEFVFEDETPTFVEETEIVDELEPIELSEEEIKLISEVESPVVEETTVEEDIEESPVEEHRLITEMIQDNNQVVEDEIVEEIATDEVETIEETETIDEVESPVVEEPIIEEGTPVGKLLPKVTQRLQYSSKPITYYGENVGIKLTINANGEKDVTEIRYLASKKKIRITSSEGVEFVKVDDTIIPPMNQINNLLREIANKKHIDNADSLTIL